MKSWSSGDIPADRQPSGIAPAAAVRPAYAALAGLYEELCSPFNKIYVCAQTGDAVLSVFSAVCLQKELPPASAEQGSQASDILGAYVISPCTADRYRQGG